MPLLTGIDIIITKKSEQQSLSLQATRAKNSVLIGKQPLHIEELEQITHKYANGNRKLLPINKFGLEINGLDGSKRFDNMGGTTLPNKSIIISNIDRNYSRPYIPPISNSTDKLATLTKVLYDEDSFTPTVKLQRPNPTELQQATQAIAAEDNLDMKHYYSRVGRKIEAIRHLSDKINNNKRRHEEPSYNDDENVSLFDFNDSTVEPLPISVKYLSLANWIFPSGEPNSNDAFVLCAELMLVRESSIIKLWDLCDNLENEYWKYCLMRIISFEKRKKTNSERLIAKVKTVKSLQKEVSVCIAHLRGITIELLESIQNWRKIAISDTLSPVAISLYYNNENYLLKMSNDLLKFNSFSVLRIWIGHSFNTMITNISSIDNNNNNDEMNYYDRLYMEKRGLYEDWLRRRYGSVPRLDAMSIRSSRNTNINNISISSSFSTATYEVLNHNNLQCSISAINNAHNSSDKINNSSFNSSGGPKLEQMEKLVSFTESLKKSTHDDDDEEEEEEEQEDTFDDLEDTGIQNNDINGLVEQDKHHVNVQQHQSKYKQKVPRGKYHPEELFTVTDDSSAASLSFCSMSLVSKSGEWSELRQYCENSWGMLDNLDEEGEGEGDSSQERGYLVQGRDVAPEFWNKLDHNPLVVEAAIGFKEVVPSTLMPLLPQLPEVLITRANKAFRIIENEKRLIQKYEEKVMANSNSDVFKTLVPEAVKSLSKISSKDNLESNFKQAENMKYRQQSQGGKFDGSLQSHIRSIFQSTVLSSSSLSPQKFEGGDFFEMTAANTSENNFNGNTSSFFSSDIAKPLEIKALKEIQKRIDSSMQLTEKVGYLRTFKEDKQGNRYPDEYTQHFKTKCALRVAIAMKTFLIRRRIHKEFLLKRHNKNATDIQKIIRGFLARKNLKEFRKKYHIETIILRKYYTRRFRAAIIITNFIRRSAEINQAFKDGIPDFKNSFIHERSDRARLRFRQVLTDEEMEGLPSMFGDFNRKINIDIDFKKSTDFFNRDVEVENTAALDGLKSRMSNPSRDIFNEESAVIKTPKPKRQYAIKFAAKFSKRSSSLIPPKEERGKTCRLFAASTKERAFLKDDNRFMPPRQIISQDNIYMSPLDSAKSSMSVINLGGKKENLDDLRNSLRSFMSS